MSEQDSDQRTEHDADNDSRESSQPDSGNAGQDGDGEATSESASGVVVEGYETHNAPREQTKALLEAESPDDVEDDLIKEIEEERDRRLDPENRPPNTEVDNTKRVFVPAEAKFEDSEIDQDPSLGQEGLAPVGGDKDPARDTGSEDSDHSGEDPQDDTEAVTSGTSDPTVSGHESSGDSGSHGRGGKHKA